MSKRKNKAPVQLDLSKRCLLTWNMNEGNQPEASTSYNAILRPLDSSEVTAETSLGPSSSAGHGKKSAGGSSESESAAEQSDAKLEVRVPHHHITQSEYKTLWTRANYSITVHEQRPQNIVCHLGLITLSLTPHQLSKTWGLLPSEASTGNPGPDDALAPLILPKQIPRGRCSLFVGPSRPHHLVFDYAPDNAENVPNGLFSTVYPCLEAVILDEPAKMCLDGLERVCNEQKSKLKLVRRGYCAKTGQLSLAVCLLQPALSVPKFASEPVLRRLDYAHHMQSIMHWLHGFEAPAPREVATSKRHDFNRLFDAVRRRHWQNGDHAITLAVQVQHPCLVPTLREYQRQAVSWMLRKERFGEKTQEGEEETGDGGQLHCMWSELELGDQTLYYNYHSGQFTRQRFTQQSPFPGGILADEMGLGKTVEALACILAHPRYPAMDAVKQTDEMSVDTESRLDLPHEIMDTGMESQSSSQSAPHKGLPDNDCVQSKTGGTDATQEASWRITEQADIATVEAKTVEAEAELMSQSTAGTSQEMRATDLEIHPQLTNGELIVCEISRTDPRPQMLLPAYESSKLGVAAPGSGWSCEKTTTVLDTNNSETKSTVGNRMAEVSAKSEDTNRTNGSLLSDVPGKPKPEVPDALIKPESVNLTIDAAKLPSQSQDLIPEGTTYSSEKQDKGEIQLCLNPDISESNHKDEHQHISQTNSAVKDTRKSLDTEAALEGIADLEHTTPNGASRTTSQVDPQSTAPSTREVTDEQSDDNPTKPLKKPKKQPPKGPMPNPYSRLRSKEPPKFRFECICGVHEGELDPELSIQCQQCGGWQHCICVNYNNQALGNDRYLCPLCCIEQPAVPSGATLIVSPSSICHQWVDEINRHVQTQSLNILVYNGVKKQGFLQPRKLAEHDIVITTYETLRMELNYVGLPHTNRDGGRRLRHAKRYMAVPSPLPAVEWWRVCLDEAQMVESPTAKVAEMALRLTAVNRWCVTGTPIQKDLDNLYGLFLFLGVEPYWVKSWWESILYKPYLRGNQEPMEKALAEVLWRSAKKDVIHQINIPPQTKQTHWLQFSPIETHFYKRQRENCSKDFLEVAGRMKTDVKTRLSSLARDTVNRLMNPLLSLRQACCHPQAVRGEFISMQRTTLTMSELLQSLTLKAKVESEETHRQLVCALNGLAAVCIIKGETLDAVQHYRDILQSVEEHKDRLKTDSLQRLHAMHNLHGLLKLKPDGLVPTLRDGELEQQVQEIRDAYLAKAEASLQSSLFNLLPIQEKISELKAKLSPKTPWWLDGLQWLQYLGVDEEFVDKIKDSLTSTTHMDSMSVVNHFSTLRGLQMVLVTKMEDLDTAYKRLQEGMARLSVDVTQELVAEATDCHLRPFGGKPKNRCPFCRVHTLFTEYETCLFSIKQRDVLADADTDDEDTEAAGPRLQGSWAASETERILRALLASLRQHGGDEELLEEGGAFMEMMEAQKKEFKSMRVTWTMLCERVAAWDELKMATMRLRLREAHEPEEITSQANVIEPGELNQQRFKLLNDRVLAQSELKKKLGQLVYLKSLAKAQSDLPDGNNPEACPICIRELGKQWTVLPCGHSFCNNCMDLMQTHRGGKRKTVRCAVCRAISSIQEISYVSTEPCDPQEDCYIPVKGGFSSKVEAVVRTLLQLREQDPNVKAIVFSTWVDVLTVIARALTDNHVEFRSIGPHGERHFKKNLMEFKQDERVTALLLPVHSGSKGLNIIEATHVLLVEPILNPASELQAVGRVHRIGQTRPTIVHRFLVRDTIEERLQEFLQANHTSDSLDNLEGETGALTLETLKQLFTGAHVAPDNATANSFDSADDEYS